MQTRMVCHREAIDSSAKQTVFFNILRSCGHTYSTSQDRTQITGTFFKGITEIDVSRYWDGMGVIYENVFFEYIFLKFFLSISG